MPRGRPATEITRLLEPLTVVAVLPVFLGHSGLSTRLSVVVDPTLLLVAVVILRASILAEGGACWAAARLTGQGNATALGIGTARAAHAEVVEDGG